MWNRVKGIFLLIVALSALPAMPADDRYSVLAESCPDCVRVGHSTIYDVVRLWGAPRSVSLPDEPSSPGEPVLVFAYDSSAGKLPYVSEVWLFFSGDRCVLNAITFAFGDWVPTVNGPTTKEVERLLGRPDQTTRHRIEEGEVDEISDCVDPKGDIERWYFVARSQEVLFLRTPSGLRAIYIRAGASVKASTNVECTPRNTLQ